MKKLLALMLVGVMLLAGTSYVCAEDEMIKFEPVFTNVMEYSAKEWFQSAGNRAILVVALMLDFQAAFNDVFEFDISNEAYVGRTGNNISVGLYNDKEVLFLFYDAYNGQAGYYVMESAYGSIVLEMAMEESNTSTYEVSANDIIDCVTQLADLL